MTLEHFNPLKKKIEGYSRADQLLIKKAFDFADNAHKGQPRATGEDYIIHPVAVAGILADMRLDAGSVVTGLLHDTVEDTDTTFENIQRDFGPNVANLVQGVTKLSKIEVKSHETKQAENFRKLVLAMSDDIRVLLVKLADRLHNMQTLAHKPSAESRKRTALETMEIYAPLAERIGMHKIQEELQDLALKELQPEAYESISKRISMLEVGEENIIKAGVEDLKKTLFSVGIIGKVDVYGRKKTVYSIWHKMHHKYKVHYKDMGLEQPSDVIAFRIIVNSVADCYQALGAIHDNYVVLPGRFKDYIGTPKANHYQSLHTEVIGHQQRPIEIQIRTKEMHDIAEYGVAAHWEYKETQSTQHSGKEREQYLWLRNLLDILETANGPEEFLKHTKMDLHQDQIFCFTPSIEIVSLPKGATCIDFAYAVHSDIGNKCTSAKINNRLVPLRTQLSNGDQVEVITSPNHEPSLAWEKFVVTGRARSSIRRYIRSKTRGQFIALGTLMLEKAFSKEGKKFEKKVFEPILEQFTCQDVDDLLAGVGSSQYTTGEIIHALFYEQSSKVSGESLALNKPTSGSPSPVSIKELIPGIAVHYAKCCHPLPGDKIVGIRIKRKGMTIHTLDCDVVSEYEDKPDRLEDVYWNEPEGFQFMGRLKVFVMNKPGNLGVVGTMIGSKGCNIGDVKLINREREFSELIFDLEVKNLEQLESVISSLRACEAVAKIERV